MVDWPPFRATRFPWSWNTMAALAGLFRRASRGLWGVFWTFLILEALAFVQIGRGWWGDLGADKLARVARLNRKTDEFMAKHEAAKLAGDPDAASFLNRVENRCDMASLDTALRAYSG